MNPERYKNALSCRTPRPRDDNEWSLHMHYALCKVHYGQQIIVPLRGEQELYGSSGHAIVGIWGMFNRSSDGKSRVLVQYSSQYSAAGRK